MNETIKNLLERRSVRGYKEDLVPEEVLNEILEAGEYAPSGMGQQGTLMVVTQNPELVAKLSKMNADVMGTESDPFYGAPTVVVVFADSNMPTCVENGSLVMGNLMNAAHALGVDSCWIHRAREVFASEDFFCHLFFSVVKSSESLPIISYNILRPVSIPDFLNIPLLLLLMYKFHHSSFYKGVHKTVH